MRACATGSPASTRSTKLMPLTTRPSRTSRQGMTRILSIDSACHRQRGFEIDAAVIKRSPQDRTDNPVALMRFERGDIVKGGHTARGDHRRLERPRQCRRRPDIDAGERAVALDIREDNRRRAGILDAAREIESRHLRRFGPALDRDFPPRASMPTATLPGNL